MGEGAASALGFIDPRLGCCDLIGESVPPFQFGRCVDGIPVGGKICGVEERDFLGCPWNARRLKGVELKEVEALSEAYSIRLFRGA